MRPKPNLQTPEGYAEHLRRMAKTEEQNLQLNLRRFRKRYGAANFLRIILGALREE